MQKTKSQILLLALASLISSQTIFYGEFTKNDLQMNALSTIRNQNQPTKCGASWAFAIASSMSDQFNARGHVDFPEVVLSPQMLMTCGSSETNRTCDYSEEANVKDVESTLNHLLKDGISDESCNNWFANTTKACDNLAKCMDCMNGENIQNEPNCFSRDYHSYKLKDWKSISAREIVKDYLKVTRSNIISALNTKGPVLCNIQHSEQIFHHRISKEEIYTEDGQKEANYNTWVSIVGFIDAPDSLEGVANLWMVRLSFGDSVGRYGYIYLNADENKNNLGILNNCYSLEVDVNVELIPNSDKKTAYKGLFRPMISQGFDITKPRFGFSTATATKMRADEGVGNDNFEPIFWGNHNGRNYLTWIKNQHIPVYCGSCWAQAATSVLNDRLNINNINKGKTFPKHVFSVQAIINCALGGTCMGGDSGLMWEEAKQWKIPTETCRVYEAKNPERFSCSEETKCMNTSRDDTWNNKQYNGIKVLEWKNVRGEHAIKSALQDGPLACSFEVTDKFEEYKPDPNKRVIYEEFKDFFETNHVVSIVGWDKEDGDSGKEYWIVRNSWGVEYGYNGMFYFATGNLLGMEASCVVPTELLYSDWDE